MRKISLLIILRKSIEDITVTSLDDIHVFGKIPTRFNTVTDCKLGLHVCVLLDQYQKRHHCGHWEHTRKISTRASLSNTICLIVLYNICNQCSAKYALIENAIIHEYSITRDHLAAGFPDKTPNISHIAETTV